MSTPNLIIGIFFIVLSIIIFTFPNTIAGYNTLSNEEKKKIIARLHKINGQINGVEKMLNSYLKYFFLWE